MASNICVSGTSVLEIYVRDGRLGRETAVSYWYAYVKQVQTTKYQEGKGENEGRKKLERGRDKDKKK